MQDSLHGGGNIFLNYALCSELCRITDEPIIMIMINTNNNFLCQ